MRTRTSNGEKLGSLKIIVSVPLQSHDSVNSLALKYGCSASELKRINKLHKDQDLYALKTFKVPVIKHGTIHENIKKEFKNISEDGEVEDYEANIPESDKNKNPINQPTDSMNDFLKNLNFVSNSISSKDKSYESSNTDMTLLVATEISELPKSYLKKKNFFFSQNPIKTIERKPSKINWNFIITILICMIILAPVVFMLSLFHSKYHFSKNSTSGTN